MTYRIDGRSHEDLVATVTHAAGRVAVPGLEPLEDGGVVEPPVTWQQVLADDAISADLMRELLRGHHTLLDHAATIPDRAARHWLESTCEIEALVPRSASAVVVAEVADDAGPVLVEAGTELKGPKDRAGDATLFATDDHLIASGARLLGVRSYAVWNDHDADATSDGEALQPFASAVARHELYLCSSTLRFAGGELVVTLDFTGVGIDVTPFADLTWEYSGAEGPVVATATVPTGSTKQLQLTLRDACLPAPAPAESGDEDHCWLRVRTSSFDPAALSVAFDSVTITVKRSGLTPDSGWYNDGSVDLQREFTPFGDVPRRGDSFFLQSEEAFTKPLKSLSIILNPLSQSEYDLQFALLFPIAVVTLAASVQDPMATGGNVLAASAAASAAPAASPFEGELAPFFRLVGDGSVNPTIDWQNRASGSWATMASRTKLVSVHNLDPSRGLQPASDPTTVGGVEGHFVRGFLSAGDFGWDAYQEGLVKFANHVGGVANAPEASMPVPPKPPTLLKAEIAYTTIASAPDRLIAVNGHHRRSIVGGRPFAHPVADQLGTDPAGEVVVGLDVADQALGQTLSVWFEIDSTAACSPSTGDDLSRWEYWSGAGWTRLSTSDTSSSLRTSGLVRFVTPLDWPLGCPHAGAIDGRWMRLATNQPDRIGTIEAIYPDAVLATALPAIPGATDDSPVADLDAPEPEALKGPNTRIAGVKKLTNPLPGRASRPVEDDGSYLRRAPQVTRTRNRLVQPIDYELDVRANFPEVAFVAAIPHFDGTDDIAPGHVGLVVIPASTEPAPLPSADLVTRIEASVGDRAPVHATVAVHCPSYRRVGVNARIVLARGAVALTSRAQIAEAIDHWLHPLQRPPEALGRPLYRSEIIVLLEGLSVVDRVESIDLSTDDGSIPVTGPTGLTERIDPPSPRHLGIVVSSGIHDLELQEQLA